jgi:hypothetical protein
METCTSTIMTARIVDKFLSANASSDKYLVPWYTTTKSPPNAPIQPSMDLDIPAFGIVFMNPPEAARHLAESTQTEPVYTTYLSGELVVRLPEGCERVVYESIYIGFRAFSKLLIDIKKPVVEDELYNVGHEIPGGIIEGEARCV